MKRDRLTKRLKSAINWIQEYRGLSIRVIVIPIAIVLFLSGIIYLWFLLAPHLNTIEGVKTLISLISTLATAIAGLLVLWNIQIARRNARQGEEKLITKRFSKAVEQLGGDKIEVRLGGIYSLERIAKDSPKDHWTIMEVLTAFIREKCPLPSTPETRYDSPKIATDVQAALTVIGQRTVEQDPESKFIDLRFTNLIDADLINAKLTNAILVKVNLTNSFLINAKFINANLSSAFLFRVDLREADLTEANLEKSDLSGADLSGAVLSKANFCKANLNGANLKNTKKLTPEQVKSAENWKLADYDPDFRKQLGLPPE